MVLDDTATGSRVRACDTYLGPREQTELYAHCAGLAAWAFDKPIGSFPGAHMRRGVCMQAAGGITGYQFARQEVPAGPLDGVLGAPLARVNADLGTDFNSWLLNWYRPRGVGGSQGDYLSPHSDDERQLAAAKDGGAAVFGLTLTSQPKCRRELRFTPKKGGREGAEPCSLVTHGGQAYVMEGHTQKHWLHSVPRSLRVPGSRISLTARKFAVAPASAQAP